MNRKLIMLAFGASSLMAVGADYTFNGGDSAGWTYNLVRVTPPTSVAGIRTGSAFWIDSLNYPNAPTETDPLGDGNGAASGLVGSSDYTSAEAGDSLLLQLLSPDLTTSSDWQSASLFSARLLPSFVSGAFTPDHSANMAVVVKDMDAGRERSFVTGLATPIADSTWSVRTFDFAPTLAIASPPVVHYQVKQVIINFYLTVAPGRFIADVLRFNIDEVVPRCGATVYYDEAEFLAATGLATIYGFETHRLSGDVNDLPASPIPASNLDGNFDLAYGNLDGLNVANSPGSPCNIDGTKALFTHSLAAAGNYSLTFSNFGGRNRAITAFGFTVCDFANGIPGPATITYDTGTQSGVLLVVPHGQPDYTHNFAGVVVCPESAFHAITLTLNDNASGMQWFDKVIYSGMFLGGRRSGGNLLITWQGLGQLEAADRTAGPWTNVPGATSPYSAPMNENAKFFRLHFQ